MKANDQTTWITCDHCGKDAQCRFFEVLTDAGAQITVWWDEPYKQRRIPPVAPRLLSEVTREGIKA